MNLRSLIFLIATIAAAQSPRQPMARTLQGGMPARWWRNPDLAEKLKISTDQQKKMDDIFQQNRLKLIDLTAALDKEELVLEPLIESDPPDAAKLRAQVDRIAQARAELEKANANMLVAVRLLLTLEQWRGVHDMGPGARTMRSNASAQELIQRLEEAQRRLNDVRRSYQPSHPEYQNAAEAVAQLQLEIERRNQD